MQNVSIIQYNSTVPWWSKASRFAKHFVSLAQFCHIFVEIWLKNKNKTKTKQKTNKQTKNSTFNVLQFAQLFYEIHAVVCSSVVNKANTYKLRARLSD